MMISRTPKKGSNAFRQVVVVKVETVPKWYNWAIGTIYRRILSFRNVGHTNVFKLELLCLWTGT